jgi:RND family efflux transporter MFP subunit
VKVVKATRDTISSAITYSGNIQAKAQVSVVPKVPGRLEKLNVDVGSTVKAGDVIAEIDSATLNTQVAQAEAALALAEAKLAMIDEGPRAAAVAQAEAGARAAAEKVASLQTAARAETVAQAEASLSAAKAKLEQLKKGAIPEQVNAAKLAVEQAKDALYVAQTNKDGVCGGKYVPQYVCDGAKAQAAVAETAVHQAEAQLAIVTAAPTAEQVAQAQAGVDAAQQELELAKKPVNDHDLAQAQAAADAAAKAAELAKQPFTANDRKAAQAGVDQAKAALEAARLLLKDATITAPLDGSISQKYLSQGAMAAPSTPIVGVISSEVEVVVNVEEGRLSQVEVGQPAVITVAAYPGDEFPAKVASRAPSLDPRSRTLAVRVAPDANAKLLDGMFAQVRITGASHEGALLVPAQAVLQREGKSVCFAVQNGRAGLREVTTGLGDGTRVEVLSGLAEGDEVVVSGQENLVDSQAVTVQP